MVKAFPRLVSETFAIINVRYLSFTHALVCMVRDHWATGAGLNSFRRSLESQHKLVFHRQHERYLLFWHQRGERLPAGQEDGVPPLALVPPPFGDFYSKAGWQGAFPSRAMIRELAIQDNLGRREFHTRHMQMLEVGPVAKGDASKKIVKFVRSNGAPVYQSLFTVMNR